MNSDILTASASRVVQTSMELSQRWTREKAREWYAHRRWPVGCNYIPSTASNQLEMWQADTFDPQRIDIEFGWAAGLGFNAIRVFLHDLVWLHDAAGYLSRIDQFLCIASRHGIDTLVIFDSCWDPATGRPQEAPRRGVHNSRWVQSPGCAELSTLNSHPRLRQRYRARGQFRGGPENHGLTWNEPDNDNGGSYPPWRLPTNLPSGDLIPQVDWVHRRAVTTLTSGIWFGDWSSSRPYYNPAHR
jgi:hypothetical protein